MIGIYKFTSKITGQSYIGQSIHIEERYNQHLLEMKNTRSQSKWYQALREQGIENFEFSILEECKPDDLNEREIYWISYYNSFKDGYNSSPGGQSKFFDPQIIYDAWDKGLSVAEISQETGLGFTTIRNNLIGYKNYNKHESKMRGGKLAFKSKENLTNENQIYQYDLEGNFIKEWTSCKEIERTLGFNSSLIGKCIAEKRMSAYDYQWKSYYKENISPYNNTKGKPRAIIQYDLNWNKIAYFPNLKEAQEATGCDRSLLRRVCNDYQKRTAGGFRWRWAEEVN